MKNIDRWLIIFKKCDISGPMFIDLKKIYRTKKSMILKVELSNMSKMTRIHWFYGLKYHCNEFPKKESEIMYVVNVFEKDNIFLC